MQVWFIDEYTKRVVEKTESPWVNLDTNSFNYWVKVTLNRILEEDGKGNQTIRSSVNNLYATTAIITQQYEATDGTYIIYFRPL